LFSRRRVGFRWFRVVRRSAWPTSSAIVNSSSAHSVGDNEQAVRSYLELCALGGELPFRQLLKAAHLRSPFEPGTLLEVARQAETALLHVA